MENASKALIIAGAILISILLISVGIIIMNAINDPVSKAGDSAASQSIEIFNSKFTAYVGNRIKGSTIRSMVSTINASNATDAEHTIALTSNSITVMSEINSNTTYKIDAVYAGTEETLDYAGTYTLAGATDPKSETGYIFELTVSE